MNEYNISKDLESEILKAFRSGNGRISAAAQILINQFKAQISSSRLTPAEARQILADTKLVSALKEKTRQDIAAAKERSRSAKAAFHAADKREVQAVIPQLLANSEQTLADIGRMHGQLTALLSAVQDEQAKVTASTAELKATADQIVAHTAATVAATAEMKLVSDQAKIDVPRILEEAMATNGKLRLWPTLRTAAITAGFLTPFTLGFSVVGNKLTNWWDTGHWRAELPATPLPQQPQIVIYDQRQNWIIMLPPNPKPVLPFPSGKPFIITPAAILHQRPYPPTHGRKAASVPLRAER